MLPASVCFFSSYATEKALEMDGKTIRNSIVSVVSDPLGTLFDDAYAKELESVKNSTPYFIHSLGKFGRSF